MDHIFTVAELRFARELGRLRNQWGPNPRAATASHEIGVLGELAVERLTGAPAVGAKLYPDGGVDYVCHLGTVDVKCRRSSDDLYQWESDPIRADYYVLVNYRLLRHDVHTARVVGFATRQQMNDAKVFDKFDRGPTRVIHRSQLSPMEWLHVPGEFLAPPGRSLSSILRDVRRENPQADCTELSDVCEGVQL